MTTALMEQGSHKDSGETYAARDLYYATLEAKVRQTTGEMAVQCHYDDKATLNEQVPFSD